MIVPFAKTDKVKVVSGLPKTRSGKIMRRILRKIAEGDDQNLGDTSTLLNPEIVDELKNKTRHNGLIFFIYSSPTSDDSRTSAESIISADVGISCEILAMAVSSTSPSDCDLNLGSELR